SEFARYLSTTLPHKTYRSVVQHGATTFHELFSARQLLVGLEYANGIHELFGEMLEAEIFTESIEALATFLAFFVGFLTDRNSMLCGWDAMRNDCTSSFVRSVPVFSRVFVERSHAEMAEEWLGRIVPVIEATSTTPQAAAVYRGDAQKLPFTNDF